MSEGLYANPGSIKDFPSDKKKESIVDIYVSAESLRVYDNPWVESTSPNTPGPTGVQHTVTEKTRKRNHFRSCSMFLGLLCLLLLVGIICIGVQMNNNKNNCEKLLQLLANLRNERECFCRDFCKNSKAQCKWP
ncbi:uncharacterized protein LOC143419194 [Maylandia zebra]|uniref:uncharacterized protein LOC143419194 n=1 Tax=Maylandia zebra TaxID=106582 RepID=UPI00403D3AB4